VKKTIFNHLPEAEGLASKGRFWGNTFRGILQALNKFSAEG